MNLAEKLKLFRKRAHFTQQELADAIGVSIMTVRRWEWNDRTPRLEEIEKIAAALGTTTDYLLNGESEPAQNEPSKNQGNNLHINNAPEMSSDDLDLGFWGGVVERAERVARHEDNGKKTLIAGMLRMALNSVDGEALPVEKTARQIIGVQGDIHGGQNNMNVGTS